MRSTVPARVERGDDGGGRVRAERGAGWRWPARLAACLVVPWSLSAELSAQQHALVLSGGGARGLAHAGAVRALDEYGYATTFVVGASMGAIVGALHAAGYTSEEIWDIVARENWLERFAAEPIIIGAERTARRPLISLGLNSGRFQEGVVSTTAVERRLLELLFDAGVRARNDFDRLPRPFRAVAADLADGSEVVLAAGSLPKAVRASMAVPGVFAPVPWGDRVLVDGGLANNLPVSVARREAPELRVIAVDVLRPAPEIEETGPLAVGVRALRLLIERSRPPAEPDVLIRPEIAGGETRFPADATELLQTGHRAVRAELGPAGPRPPAPPPAGPAPDRIAGLEVRGAGSAMGRLARRLMADAVGPYDPQLVIRRIRALHGTGLLVSAWPHLEWRDGPDSPPTLVLELQPLAATALSAAAWWDDDDGGAAWASLRRRLDLVAPFELRLDGRAGDRGRQASLGISAFSATLPGVMWNAGVHATRSDARIFDGDIIAGRLATHRTGVWAGAELIGPGFGWHFALLGRADRVDDPGREPGWATGASFRAARMPSPDRVVGLDPQVQVDVREGRVAYRSMRASGSLDQRLGRLRTAVVGDVVWSDADAPLDVQAGSIRELAPWVRAGRWRGPVRVATGVDVAIPIILDGYARLRLRTFGTAADWTGLREEPVWRAGGEIGFIWPTVVGPIEAGIAAGRGARWRINLGVGAPGR